MIVELIVIILIVWLLFSILCSNSGKMVIEAKDFIELGREISKICKYKIPKYYLSVVEKGGSRTIFIKDKYPMMYLQVTDDSGQMYDPGTLILVYLHELTHVITPGSGHNKYFDRVEDELIRCAKKLKYIDNKTTVNPSYPSCD